MEPSSDLQVQCRPGVAGTHNVLRSAACKGQKRKSATHTGDDPTCHAHFSGLEAITPQTGSNVSTCAYVIHPNSPSA